VLIAARAAITAAWEAVDWMEAADDDESADVEALVLRAAVAVDMLGVLAGLATLAVTSCTDTETVLDCLLVVDWGSARGAARAIAVVLWMMRRGTLSCTRWSVWVHGHGRTSKISQLLRRRVSLTWG
jgi:hypothetical protein